LSRSVCLLTIENRAVERYCFGKLRLHLGQHLCGFSQPRPTSARWEPVLPRNGAMV
jgi:hypothetical protein